MLLIASFSLLEPGPILGPEVPGDSYLMDRNLLSMCAVPRRMMMMIIIIIIIIIIISVYWRSRIKADKAGSKFQPRDTE